MCPSLAPAGGQGSPVIHCLHNFQAKTDQFVTNCVDIAAHHGFQGWLVNIENVVREDLVPALIDMLAKVDIMTRKKSFA